MRWGKASTLRKVGTVAAGLTNRAIQLCRTYRQRFNSLCLLILGDLNYLLSAHYPSSPNISVAFESFLTQCFLHILEFHIRLSGGEGGLGEGRQEARG